VLSSSQKSQALLAWLILLPLLALIYYPAFPGPFLLDDGSSILSNSEIREINLQNILNLFRSHRDVRALDHHPVPGLTFLLDYQWAGYESWAYRVTNLVIHWLCAGAAFLLLLNLWRKAAPDSPFVLSGSLAVVYLWALHPLSSMPVAYITCRQESLMVLLALLSLWLLASNREELSLIAAAACFLSKEVAVTLPFALFALEWIQSGSTFFGTFRSRPRYFAALTIAWGFLCYWHLKGGRTSHVKARDMPLSSSWDYFRAQCGVIVDYFSKLFVPIKLKLYPWIHKVDSWTDWVPQAIALSLLFALGVWFLWRGPRWAGFCLLWPFFILGPTSSFIPIPYEPAMEYRMYLPALPLLALLVFLALRYIPRPRLVFAACAAWAITLGILSHLRARDYETSISIFSQQVSVEPTGLFAWDALAGSYIGAGLQGEGKKAAWKLVDLALVEKAPDLLSRGFHHLAVIEIENKHDDQAIDFLRRGIAASGMYNSKVALAGLLMRRGQNEEAAKLIQDSLDFMPDRADALFLLYELKMQANDLAAAEEVLDRIAKFHPGHSALEDQQTRLLRRKAGRTTR
jgi:tetratricopeptide (TPR) repeat protein